MKKNYSQTEKIAILLISLGEETSIDLIQKLPKTEAQKVLQTMSRMGKVDQETVLSIQTEFNTLLKTLPSIANQGHETAKRIFQKAFGAEEALKFDTSLPMPKPACFDEAEELEAKVLWQILNLEHPQTIALILAHLSAKKAGEITKLMHPATRTDILLRLSNMRDVDPTMLEDIAESFSKSIATAKQKATYQIGGVKRTAEILAQIDPTLRKDFLERLRKQSPEVANDIHAKMFTFEDLIKLDVKGITTILGKVPQHEIELALRKSSENIANIFYKAMSDRRAQQMKENIAVAKPVSVTKINEAQAKIAQIAADLIAEGKISDPLDEAI